MTEMSYLTPDLHPPTSAEMSNTEILDAPSRELPSLEAQRIIKALSAQPPRLLPTETVISKYALSSGEVMGELAMIALLGSPRAVRNFRHKQTLVRERRQKQSESNKVEEL